MSIPLPRDRLYLVDLKARKRYRYKPDPAKQDRWVSYHKQVLANAHWEDDCDSLASTVANLIALEGHPLERLWFAHVNSSHDGTVDHMVAVVQDRNDVLWIIGDTFGPCYEATSMRHTLKKFCKLSDVTTWYEATDIRQLLRGQTPPSAVPKDES